MKKRRILKTMRFEVWVHAIWCEAWVGVVVDRPNRRVYIQPLPFVGLVVVRYPYIGGREIDLFVFDEASSLNRDKIRWLKTWRKK